MPRPNRHRPERDAPRGRKAPAAERQVERVRRLLVRRAWPRLQMSLILSATGAAGFLASFVLLRLGVWRMWLRYALAVLFAYAVFLLLLRLWLMFQGRAARGGDELFDLNLTNILSSPSGSGASASETFGGGGDFGGAGAAGSWDAPAGGALPSGGGAHFASAGGGGGGSVGSAGGGGGSGGSGGGGGIGLLDFGADDEGCVFLLLALALIAAGVLAALYVVYAAPLLLAEILVEGVLLSGLYRGMKRAGDGNWLRAVARRTWLPVLLTLASFAAAGYLLQRAAPRARSIGEAWKMVVSD